jgi:TRAP-type C4-dicarboxylate transport system permease large subunit
LIPIVIWGGIFLGIATATEVAALSVVAALIIWRRTVLRAAGAPDHPRRE